MYAFVWNHWRRAEKIGIYRCFFYHSNDSAWFCSFFITVCCFRKLCGLSAAWQWPFIYIRSPSKPIFLLCVCTGAGETVGDSTDRRVIVVCQSSSAFLSLRGRSKARDLSPLSTLFLAALNHCCLNSNTNVRMHWFIKFVLKVAAALIVLNIISAVLFLFLMFI